MLCTCVGTVQAKATLVPILEDAVGGPDVQGVSAFFQYSSRSRASALDLTRCYLLIPSFMCVLK